MGKTEKQQQQRTGRKQSMECGTSKERNKNIHLFVILKVFVEDNFQKWFNNYNFGKTAVASVVVKWGVQLLLTYLHLNHLFERI